MLTTMPALSPEAGWQIRWLRAQMETLKSKGLEVKSERVAASEAVIVTCLVGTVLFYTQALRKAAGSLGLLLDGRLTPTQTEASV